MQKSAGWDLIGQSVGTDKHRPDARHCFSFSSHFNLARFVSFLPQMSKKPAGEFPTWHRSCLLTLLYEVWTISCGLIPTGKYRKNQSPEARSLIGGWQTNNGSRGKKWLLLLILAATRLGSLSGTISSFCGSSNQTTKRRSSEPTNQPANLGNSQDLVETSTIRHPPSTIHPPTSPALSPYCVFDPQSSIPPGLSLQG